MREVRVETAGGILTVTLADVGNRNALGAAILNGLHDAIGQQTLSEGDRFSRLSKINLHFGFFSQGLDVFRSSFFNLLAFEHLFDLALFFFKRA